MPAFPGGRAGVTRSPTCQPKRECRLCSSQKLDRALVLPSTPPANAFVPEPVEQETFPLEIRVCSECGHSQLGHVVDAESLFRDYVYVSGTSPVFRKHFADYAEDVSARVGLRVGELVCEIGSNDGTLLKCFETASVVGVEPATRIAKAANASGVRTINDFFNVALAKNIRANDGPAKLILANNVMAHIDDLGAVLTGVKTLLAPDGLFVMEVQYLGDLLREGLFDMIYFEHLDYHAVTPLIEFFARNGLRLIDVKHVGTHGGSIRCYATHAERAQTDATGSVERFVREEAENEFLTVKPWQQLRRMIDARKAELGALLREMKSGGLRIVGYGAPAKLTTFLYTFEIGREILNYVVDDSPLKIGLFTPGLHIPVVGPSALYDGSTANPDVILVCAWNFAPSIIAKHEKLSGVRWITPLPELTVTT
jgi:SAM-dependent methyltransferase